MKNILIIGSARAGKTTLCNLLRERLNYQIISLDRYINTLEAAYPSLGIHHIADEINVSRKFAPFLINYLKEYSTGFESAKGYAIEGTHIDMDLVMPNIDKEEYIIIGLTYDNLTGEDFYNNLKTYDTKKDWTFHCEDYALKSHAEHFVERNQYFSEMFKKYNIKTFNTAFDRTKTFEDIINYITENN